MQSAYVWNILEVPHQNTQKDRLKAKGPIHEGKKEIEGYALRGTDEVDQCRLQIRDQGKGDPKSTVNKSWSETMQPTVMKCLRALSGNLKAISDVLEGVLQIESKRRTFTNAICP